MRLQNLAEKERDADIALGSDVVTAAVEGYGMLIVAGKGEGLETLRRALSARFGYGPSNPAPASPQPVLAEPA